MTPRRWLLIASGVALLYAGQLLTAYVQDGVPTLPSQIDRIVLTMVTIGFIVADGRDSAARTDRTNRQLAAEIKAAIAEDRAASAQLLADGNALLRRLGHVEARMSCKVEDLSDQTARIDHMWSEFAAAHAADLTAPPGVDPDVIEIGRRMRRRLADDDGDEAVRH